MVGEADGLPRGASGGGYRISGQMSDFDWMGDVERLLEVNGDDQSPPGTGGLEDVGAQLHQKNAGRLGMRATIGDLREPPYFLQQLQHFYFSRHIQFLSACSQVTCQLSLGDQRAHRNRAR